MTDPAALVAGLVLFVMAVVIIQDIRHRGQLAERDALLREAEDALAAVARWQVGTPIYRALPTDTRERVLVALVKLRRWSQ